MVGGKLSHRTAPSEILFEMGGGVRGRIEIRWDTRAECVCVQIQFELFL